MIRRVAQSEYVIDALDNKHFRLRGLEHLCHELVYHIPVILACNTIDVRVCTIDIFECLR